LKLDFGNINIKPSFMTDLGLNPGKIVIANSLTVSLNLIKANFKKKIVVSEMHFKIIVRKDFFL